MTPSSESLTIAICTRNRAADLALTLKRVLSQVELLDTPVEILVIDDGEIEPATVERWDEDAAAAGAVWRYVRKAPEARGLYASRRLAVEMSSSNILLFLDDDVAIRRGYLPRLMEWFRIYPEVAGIGGVDHLTLPVGNGAVGESVSRLFLMSSGLPGRLSRSGMNYSQALWRLQDNLFTSEFLHGCNMAFRRKALANLPALPWLTGHSPCEDLVLSFVASRHGCLLVDPDLRVNHYSVAGGRGGLRQRLTDRIRNAARFQIYRTGYLGLSFFWSAAGMLGKDLIKAAMAPQQRVSGLRDVLLGYAGAFR